MLECQDEDGSGVPQQGGEDGFGLHYELLLGDAGGQLHLEELLPVARGRGRRAIPAD